MTADYYDPRPEHDPGCLDLGPSEPNPSVISHGDRFYMTPTLGNRIVIVSSPTLDGFRNPSKCRCTTVWKGDGRTAYSAHIWSPKMVNVRGSWYMYASAVSPKDRNNMPVSDTSPSRRIVVWKGPSASQSPDSGADKAWTFLGKLAGMPSSQWAADPAVFILPTGPARHPAIFMAYSGWSLIPNHRELEQTAMDRLVQLNESQNPAFQHIFLVSLSTPTETRTVEPVMIATADKIWQVTDGRAFVATPTLYISLGRKWAGLLYSAAGSWTPNGYKIAAIQFDGFDSGADPMDPSQWTSSEWPLLQGWDRDRGDEQLCVPMSHRRIVSSMNGAWNTPDCPVGPGSPSIVWTNDNNLKPAEPAHGQVPWLVFHANVPTKDGGYARHAFAQAIFNDGADEYPNLRYWVGTPTPDATGILGKTVAVSKN